MILNRRELVAGGVAALGFAGHAGGAVPQRPLSNQSASPEAKALYRYLWSIYRRKTLTGQQESPGRERDELAYIERETGKLPAILGLDYIHPQDNLNVNSRAAEWHRSGGIASICWHWGAPDIGTGYENSKKDFDVARALIPGTPQNRAMMAQMQEIGVLLAKLRDRRVPVLWRPFHEFSGDWFWWGKHGPDAFKALWRLMYDTYTRSMGLDNLIWVLGWAGQNVDAAFYPGRAYVDIAGADIYADDHGTLAPMFGQVKRIVGDTVPICLHENGPIPDPAGLGTTADWLWFLTWHTRWLKDADQNTVEQLRSYYASERYLTKDELSFRNRR
ncbi:glycosyl hydrolase [uncultured Sphingomonas sp.]|uniref:glycosyl hydrolase n=1 Tax=uncultured Sphingomonas sp. TaxID=158754 RepID=UPI0025CD7D66|nr:glycosyl hydrolase [uncultured Sphingomonas sp.]